MDMLLYGAIAALGFGFVIFIHELGHFLFARWAGVTVHRFSIGFGPVLLKWRRGDTDYALSLLPLGGYVQMAGEEVVDAKAGTTKPEPGSFQAASYGWRALILLGGVIFNLLSSWIILFGLAFWGMPLIPARLGQIEPTVVDHTGTRQPSPAYLAGLRTGDIPVSLNGERVRSFEDILFFSVFAGGRPFTITVLRDGQLISLPATGTAHTVYDPTVGRSVIGLGIPSSTRIMFAIRPDGQPAGATDLLRPGDRLIGIDGERFARNASGEVDLTGFEALRLLQSRRSASVSLTIERAGQVVDLPPLALHRGPVAVPQMITSLETGSPAEAAGLRLGDTITAVDGQAVRGAGDLTGAINRAGAGRGMRLEIVRDGAPLTLTATPAMLGTPRLGISMDDCLHLPDSFQPDATAVALGLSPGGMLLTVVDDLEQKRIRAVTATAGTIRRITLPGPGADISEWFHRGYTPPWLLGLLGRASRPAPITELTSGMIADPVKDGAGIGSMQLRIAGDDGSDRIIDLAGLGAHAPPVRDALDLKPGQRLIGISLSGTQAVATIASDVKGLAVRSVARNAGWSLTFTPSEERPYRLQSTGEAFVIVWDASHHMIVKSLLLIPRFFAKPEAGGIDPNKTLTGPVGMFRNLKQKAEYTGFDGFLRIVALIGLNLFLVNLLPIPVTDGGQLVFLAMEAIRGKPVPARLRAIAAIIGTVMVLGLFIYVIGLDLLRLAGFM